MAHDDRTVYELVRAVGELNELYPKSERPKVDFDRTIKRLRPTRRQPERRVALQKKWAERLRGSASVTLVNEINSDEIPHLVEGFRYIERGYVRQLNIDYMVSCDCNGRCYDAEDCGCQGPSEMMDEHECRIFAYTAERLFNFLLPSGMEVIECNESCTCDAGCPNRVAQLPRDIPIEVFRTRERGWGARATIPLRKGKVAGIYTGLAPLFPAFRREEADRRIDERRSYIFDLDFREGADDDDITERFSVDGHAYGNWTRFVNHSCEPNMRVFPVIWDTIPELNQPYLAFVATEYIPARTELTIDYDPKAGEEARVSKQKGRRAMPPGARECKCGTDSCRGWVRV
ncbi:SET domain-containing protein [Trametes meyenii]|nr:SET domain-containing protein [Trametes meyenii]